MNRSVTLAFSTAVTAVLLAGCLPIELSVSGDGKVLVPRAEGFFVLDSKTGQVARVYKPQDGSPEYGLISKDGKRIVAVTADGGGGGGGPFGGGGGGAKTAALIDLPGGQAKPLFSASNVTYLRWSPDGKRVSMTRVSDEQKEGLDQNLPELKVYNTADAAGKTIAHNTSALHRWFPDGQSILYFHITKKGEGQDDYRGTLSSVNVQTGEAKPLAAMAAGQNVFFDLSPDGKKVLFTAVLAGPLDKPLGEIDPDNQPEPKLFELEVATGTVREVREGVAYAFYSPKGDKVMLVVHGDNNAGDVFVSDAAMRDLAKLVKVGEGAPLQTPGFGDNVNIYPTWLDNDTVLYFAMRSVYGTAGKNMDLIAVQADASGRRSLQSKLDAAADETEKAAE